MWPRGSASGRETTTTYTRERLVYGDRLLRIYNDVGFYIRSGGRFNLQVFNRRCVNEDIDCSAKCIYSIRVCSKRGLLTQTSKYFKGQIAVIQTSIEPQVKFNEAVWICALWICV